MPLSRWFRAGARNVKGRYPSVAATLALVVAIGGSAYAANTVRSKDIVNGQVKSQDLGKNAVTTKKIKNGSVKAEDLHAKAIPLRVVSDYDTSDDNSSLTGAGINPVLSVELRTKVESHFMISSNVEVDTDGGNNDDAFCFINKGDGSGPEDVSQRVTVDIPDTNLDRGNIANHGNAVLPAGTYTFTVYCGVNVGGQTIQFDSGDMYAFAIPINPAFPPAPNEVILRPAPNPGVEGN